MTKPVFFFGFQRSGTTLLSMMLDSHPDLAVPFSLTGLWYRYGKRLNKYNNLRLTEDLARLVNDLLSEERIRLWQVPMKRATVLNRLPLGNYPAVIQRFHTIYALHHGKSRWGHLDISTLTQMDDVVKWFPDSIFVHMVRDARDVALSNQGIPYSIGNIAECAAAWHRDVGANLKMGGQLGSSRYLVVRYEDLVEQTESTLRIVCAFIDLPFSSAMLRYPLRVPQRVPAERQFLWPRLGAPPDPTRTFRWKTEMSAAQRTLAERIAAPTLQALGYSIQTAPRARWRAGFLGAWYWLGSGHRWPRLAHRLGFAKPRSSL